MERKPRATPVQARQPRLPGSEDVLDTAGIEPLEGNDGGQAWTNAERSRPDLDDETTDGLDPLEESVRQAAEDIPLGPLDDDDPALPYVGETEPTDESLESVGNEGDVPGLTDQGDDSDGDGNDSDAGKAKKR